MRRSLLRRVSAGCLVWALVGVVESGADELRDVIDREISAAWRQEKIEPAPPASDAEFLRRVYLDLIGAIPTYEEARAFLDDTAADKRAKLIDRLLADPRYAPHQADVWDMVYFGRNPPGFDARARAGFQRWLTGAMSANMPYDEVARRMLKAEGNTVEQGAPMFLVQYRNKPSDAAEKITQTFLGVQLQCARCHDHPFEAWTQVDFYGVAAFLARLEVIEVGKRDKEKMLVVGEKNRGEIEFTGPASESEPGKKGEPVPAKFLLASALAEPELPEDLQDPRNFPSGKVPPKPRFSRKDALADWVASRDNPYFARATANRVWAQFMGRGLVHPVDNMSESNPASHEALLAALAAALVEHDFDLKWFIRELLNSDAYQLASTGPTEAERPEWFERARVRPLSAEELTSAWRVATSYVQADPKAAERIKQERYYPLTSGYVLSFFGKPANGVGDFQGGLHEHLYLNNGQLGQLISNNNGGLLMEMAEGEGAWPARVERLYLAILSRRPTAEETQHFAEYFAAEEKPHERVRDAIWALMTSSEFRFNH